MNRWGVEPEQAKVFIEMEELINKPLMSADEVWWDSIGVQVEKNNIIGLLLCECNLDAIPQG